MAATFIGVHVKATLKNVKYFHFSLLNDAFTTAMKWRTMNYESEKKNVVEILRGTALKFFRRIFLAVLGKVYKYLSRDSRSQAYNRTWYP
jgi:hypothetical protein